MNSSHLQAMKEKAKAASTTHMKKQQPLQQQLPQQPYQRQQLKPHPPYTRARNLDSTTKTVELLPKPLGSFSHLFSNIIFFMLEAMYVHCSTTSLESIQTTPQKQPEAEEEQKHQWKRIGVCVWTPWACVTAPTTAATTTTKHLQWSTVSRTLSQVQDN